MLIWYGEHYKSRTVKKPGIEQAYRFIMPLYEKWVNNVKRIDEDRFIGDESKYILSKQDEIWFAVFVPMSGYLYQNNRTGELTFTKTPNMFIDSRIPMEKISDVLKIFNVAEEIIPVAMRNVKEVNIHHIIEMIK